MLARENLKYTTKSNGNIYIEYGIITILVVSFFVLSLNLVAGVVEEKFLHDFYSGKKLANQIGGGSLLFLVIAYILGFLLH